MSSSRLPMAATKADAPWYEDGLRFECQATGECCTNHGEYSHVYLTRDDVARLVAHSGMTRKAYLKTYTIMLEGYRALREEGDCCIFLENNRCSVYEARPIQCSTWPFWTSNLKEKTWNRDVAPFCAGVGKGRLFSREEIEAIAATNDEGEP